jgi:hypothetical protein
MNVIQELRIHITLIDSRILSYVRELFIVFWDQLEYTEEVVPK